MAYAPIRPTVQSSVQYLGLSKLAPYKSVVCTLFMLFYQQQKFVGVVINLLGEGLSP